MGEVVEEKKHFNKAGDTRGIANKTRFTSDSETQKHATESKRRNKENAKKRNVKQAITKSRAITETRHKTITPELQNYIANRLVEPDDKGRTYIYDYIDEFLKQAKDDPNSRAGMLLASSMFNEKLLTTLDESVNKRIARDTEFAIYRLRNTLYDKQQAVFDNDIDDTIEIIGSRRIGKTELNARLLAKSAVTPNSPSLYLNRSFENATRQIGPSLEQVLQKLDIKYTGSVSNGRIEFENGSYIMISGFNNKGDIDKFRGFKFKTILIDEVSHLRNPRILIEEVLEPTQIDFEKHQIIFTGTPPRNKSNYAYQLWHNPNVKHYAWTFLDNPFLPNRDRILEEVIRKHNTTIEDPFIRREYLGDLEAFDENALVFRGYQTYEKLPNKPYSHAYIGVDWGFEDEAAVISAVVVDNRMYIVDEWHMSKQGTSVIATEVKRQYDNLHEMKGQRLPQVICDTNDKSGSWELYSTYKIPNVTLAYKYEKNLALDQLAEWMRQSNILLKPDSYLSEEAENTLWQRDEETDEITHELDDDAYHANGMMAVLYMSRQFGYDIMGQTELTNKEAKHVV